MKVLACFNMIGVLALAILCAAQWDINRKVNLEAIALDKTRQEQAQKITEQERAIVGYKADLDSFRKRLEDAEATIKEGEKQIARITSERDQAAAERDAVAVVRDRAQAQVTELKATLDEWIAAVKLRDGALNKFKDQFEQAMKDRNDAVARFNDLAAKYNALVKNLEGKGKEAAK